MSVPNTFAAVTSATGAQLDADFAACVQLNAANVLTGRIDLAAPVILASLATVALGAAASNNVQISGVTPISAFDTIAAGAIRYVTWTGAVPLTYNATSMQLVGATNRTNGAGDFSIFMSLGSGNWKELTYQQMSGIPITPITSVAANLYNEQYLGGF
jgi:hypothetical protein